MNFFKRIYKILSREGFLYLFKKTIVYKKNRDLEKFMAQKQWDKAVIVAENLVEIFPDKLEYYQRLSRCFTMQGNDELASYTLYKGLKLIINPEKVIERLKWDIDSNSSMKSNYVYMGGEQNLACIEHIKIVNGEVRKYLTKISTISGYEREKNFYLEIYNTYKQIREITPKLINFIEISADNLALITMEEIEGTEPVLDMKTIKKAIKANKSITSIKYSEIKNLIPIIDEELSIYGYKNPNHPIYFINSFVSIHKKSTNQQLFHLIYTKMKAKRYSPISYILMKRLEKIIIDYELYNQVNPDLHYSLQHGDFYDYNMLVEKETNKLYILDWGSMRVGPSWGDLAGLFGQLKLPFYQINELYLIDLDTSYYLDKVEKLFFIYTLIVTWFIVFTRNEFEEKQNLFLLPAIEEVEAMAIEMIDNEKFIRQKVIR